MENIRKKGREVFKDSIHKTKKYRNHRKSTFQFFKK